MDVVLRTILSSYKIYNQIPAEYYGILSRLFIIGFIIFYINRLEYTRSEKEVSVYRVRNSNMTPTILTLKTAVLPVPVI